MKGLLGRLGREWRRQTVSPTAGARVSGVHASALSPATVEPSTRAGPDGRGLDLFLIGRDTIGDPTTYLGNDPVDPLETEAF